MDSLPVTARSPYLNENAGRGTSPAWANPTAIADTAAARNVICVFMGRSIPKQPLWRQSPAAPSGRRTVDQGRHLAASRSSALAKTNKTPKTPRTTPAWSASLQAFYWRASPYCHFLGVLGVLCVLAHPPDNEIPCGWSAHHQWHFIRPTSKCRKMRTLSQCSEADTFLR